MSSQQQNSLSAPLCGGGAFLLFLDRFLEGVAGYAVSAVGVVMVVVGLWLFIKGQKIIGAGREGAS